MRVRMVSRVRADTLQWVEFMTNVSRCTLYSSSGWVLICIKLLWT